MIDINCFAPKIQRIASMGTVLFRRNTGVFQGKNRSQRRETVRFGLMGFDSLLLYDLGFNFIPIIKFNTATAAISEIRM